MWTIKRFNKDDFNNADKVDRIYMSIVQPNDFILDNSDFEYLQTLERLFLIVSKAVDEKEKKMLIASNIQASSRVQVSTIYEDLQRLYGYFDNSLNKHIAKMMFQRAQYRIIEKMETILEYSDNEQQKIHASETIRKTWETLAQFYQFKENEKQNINIPKIVRNIHPIYDTTNSKTE